MIRFGWRRGSTEIAHLSCAWSFTREDLANLIAAAVLPSSYDDMAAPRSKKELEEAVRELLARNADRRHWWPDEYREDHAGEPGYAEVLEWARGQAARF